MLVGLSECVGGVIVEQPVQTAVVPQEATPADVTPPFSVDLEDIRPVPPLAPYAEQQEAPTPLLRPPDLSMTCRVVAAEVETSFALVQAARQVVAARRQNADALPELFANGASDRLAATGQLREAQERLAFLTQRMLVIHGIARPYLAFANSMIIGSHADPRVGLLARAAQSVIIG